MEKTPRLVTIAVRLWRCWLLPVCAAIATAVVTDALLIVAQSFGPAPTRYGTALSWLRVLPALGAGAAARLALPATALCGILYLLRTGRPPFRYPLLAGLALSLVWVAATLAVAPPREPPVYRVTIGPVASGPDGATSWPPFGPAYFPNIEALCALASAAAVATRWRG